MDEIMNYSSIDTVEELTNVINNELHTAAISFVRVGYLLKRARDEDILKDSGYPDIYVYANTKFGLDKSQVSRFMRINDRYSIGGYSEHLKEEYEGFGYSKLALMLALPDEINEELSPEYSKSEINAIKTEYEAEQKISDMEVMMEEKEDGPDEFVALIVKELNDEHPDAAIYLNDTMKLAAKMGITVNYADIMEAYIPDGVATYSIRIPGQGRFMVSMKQEGITILNMRDPENKSPLTWQEFKDVLLEDMKVRNFPEEEKKPEKKKPEKVKPAKPKKAKGLTEEEKKETEEFFTPIVKGIKAKYADVAPEQPESEPETGKIVNNEPEIVENPEKVSEIVQEEQKTDNGQQAAGSEIEKVEGEEITPEDMVKNEIYQSIRNLEEQIRANNWSRALMYLEDIEFRINRLKKNV